MPRIRRGDKRIRGSNGGRTRNEECCCGEVVTCDNWNAGGVRATITFNVEIDGVVISTTGCANCTGVSLSRVVAYDDCSQLGSITKWCNGHQVTSCNVCGGLSNEPCCDFLDVDVSCFGDNLLITVRLYVANCPTTTPTRKWMLTWQDTVTVASFPSGTEIDIPLIDYNPTGGTCSPSTYLGSVARISFSI